MRRWKRRRFAGPSATLWEDWRVSWWTFAILSRIEGIPELSSSLDGRRRASGCCHTKCHRLCCAKKSAGEQLHPAIRCRKTRLEAFSHVLRKGRSRHCRLRPFLSLNAMLCSGFSIACQGNALCLARGPAPNVFSYFPYWLMPAGGGPSLQSARLCRGELAEKRGLFFCFPAARGDIGPVQQVFLTDRSVFDMDGSFFHRGGRLAD